jgi:hypothetical protein
VQRVENLIRRADGWVFAAEDARRLAALRIGLCVLLAVRFAITDYGTVAREPGLFQPHFYMHLFERMPSPEVAATLQVCGIVAALAAAAGLALRVSLSLAVGCSLVLNGMLDSAGRVIVGDAVMALCLLVLLAAGAAASEAWSLRAPVRRALGMSPSSVVSRTATGVRYGWPVRTAMVIIALAYLFAGFQKWRYSGLPWVTSDNLRWILYASSDTHSHPNELALFVADRPLLAHLFAAGSLLLETSFPLVLFVPRLRWLLVPGAVSMHLGILLTMGLDYSALAATVVIVFVDWPVVVAWVRRSAETAPAPWAAPR